MQRKLMQEAVPPLDKRADRTYIHFNKRELNHESFKLIDYRDT